VEGLMVRRVWVRKGLKVIVVVGGGQGRRRLLGDRHMMLKRKEGG